MFQVISEDGTPCIRMGVDEHNLVFDRFSGQNQILSPLYNSNRGIVTIIIWLKNLILTTKTVGNGYLGI